MLNTEDVGDMQVPGEGRKVVRIIAQSPFDVNEENGERAVPVDSCGRKSARFTSLDEGRTFWFRSHIFRTMRRGISGRGDLTGEPCR